MRVTHGSISLRSITERTKISPRAISQITGKDSTMHPTAGLGIRTTVRRLKCEPGCTTHTLGDKRFGGINMLLSRVSTCKGSHVLRNVAATTTGDNCSVAVHPLSGLRSRSLTNTLGLIRNLPLSNTVIVVRHSFASFGRFGPSSGLPMILVYRRPTGRYPAVSSSSCNYTATTISFFLSGKRGAICRVTNPAISHTTRDHVEK